MSDTQSEYLAAKADYDDARKRFGMARIAYEGLQEHEQNSFNRLQLAVEALPPGIQKQMARNSLDRVKAKRGKK